MDMDQDTKPATVKQPRVQRRRLETRRRLMRAAFEMIARRGVEGLVIQEITELADVGYGSFYNHFPTKEALIDAVIEACVERQADTLDTLAATLPDHIEAFAAILRILLRQAEQDQTYGLFVMRTVVDGSHFQRGFGRRIRRHIKAGIEAGEFTCADTEMAVVSVGGLMLAGLLGIVRKDALPNFIDRIVATALRHLGVSERKITKALKTPAPIIELARFLEGSSAPSETRS